MKAFFEASIDAVLIIVFACIGFNLISAHLQINKAQAFHSMCIEKLESSECNAAVKNTCRNKATNLGYKLTIQDAATYDEHESCYVQLTYPVMLTFFGRKAYYSIEGYAR